MKKKLLSGLLILASFTSMAQIDLNKGLMMYLPFNGNTLDASPNGNNATNFGATLTADQWGNTNSAYFFDGTSSYMRIANAASLQCDTQITLCARVNVNGFYDGLCYANSIIDKGYPDLYAGNYNLRFIASNNISEDCNFKDNSQHNYYGSYYDQIPNRTTRNNTPHIVTSKWDCLVYTFDGVTAKMFVNGVLRHSYITSKKIGINTQDLLLGRHGNPDYPYWFNGIMDEVRIYNRALNIMEIDSVCSKTNPKQTSIKELKENTLLPIISNPVVSELVLGLEQNQMGGTLTIIDMAGRKLMQIDNLRDNKIFVGQLASGIYLVNYQLEHSNRYIKLVKQ